MSEHDQDGLLVGVEQPPAPQVLVDGAPSGIESGVDLLAQQQQAADPAQADHDHDDHDHDDHDESVKRLRVDLQQAASDAPPTTDTLHDLGQLYANSQLNTSVLTEDEEKKLVVQQQVDKVIDPSVAVVEEIKPHLPTGEQLIRPIECDKWHKDGQAKTLKDHTIRQWYHCSSYSKTGCPARHHVDRLPNGAYCPPALSSYPHNHPPATPIPPNFNAAALGANVAAAALISPSHAHSRAHFRTPPKHVTSSSVAGNGKLPIYDAALKILQGDENHLALVQFFPELNIAFFSASFFPLLQTYGDSLYVDGDFELGEQSLSVTSLLVSVEGYGIPVASVLTNKASAENYERVLRFLAERSGGVLNPQRIYADFHGPLHDALVNTFPKAQVLSDTFHFVQHHVRWILEHPEPAKDIKDGGAGAGGGAGGVGVGVGGGTNEVDVEQFKRHLRTLWNSPDAQTFESFYPKVHQFWQFHFPSFAQYFQDNWVRMSPPAMWAPFGRGAPPVAVAVAVPPNPSDPVFLELNRNHLQTLRDSAHHSGGAGMFLHLLHDEYVKQQKEVTNPSEPFKVKGKPSPSSTPLLDQSMEDVHHTTSFASPFVEYREENPGLTMMLPTSPSATHALFSSPPVGPKGNPPPSPTSGLVGPPKVLHQHIHASPSGNITTPPKAVPTTALMHALSTPSPQALPQSPLLGTPQSHTPTACSCGKQTNFSCTLRLCLACCSKDQRPCALARHKRAKADKMGVPFGDDIDDAINRKQTLRVVYDGNTRDITPLSWMPGKKPFRFFASSPQEKNLAPKPFKTEKISSILGDATVIAGGGTPDALVGLPQSADNNNNNAHTHTTLSADPDPSPPPPPSSPSASLASANTTTVHEVPVSVL